MQSVVVVVVLDVVVVDVVVVVVVDFPRTVTAAWPVAFFVPVFAVSVKVYCLAWSLWFAGSSAVLFSVEAHFTVVSKFFTGGLDVHSHSVALSLTVAVRVTLPPAGWSELLLAFTATAADEAAADVIPSSSAASSAATTAAAGAIRALMASPSLVPRTNPDRVSVSVPGIARLRNTTVPREEDGSEVRRKNSLPPCVGFAYPPTQGALLGGLGSTTVVGLPARHFSALSPTQTRGKETLVRRIHHAGAVAAGTLLVVGLMSIVPASASWASASGQPRIHAGTGSNGARSEAVAAKKHKKHHKKHHKHHKGRIFFDDTVNTKAPPTKLGPYTMVVLPSDGTAVGTSETSIGAPGGKSIKFSVTVTHEDIGNGWATWSNGYTGSVYFDQGRFLTITLPPGTKAFYLYAEPNRFKTYGFKVKAKGGPGSKGEKIFGNSGARFFGFYATGKKTLTAIIVNGGPHIVTGSSKGFAVGEFGIAF